MLARDVDLCWGGDIIIAVFTVLEWKHLGAIFIMMVNVREWRQRVHVVSSSLSVSCWHGRSVLIVFVFVMLVGRPCCIVVM